MPDADPMMLVPVLVVALSATMGLFLSVSEWRAAWADEEWRRTNGLNGIGSLVAADAGAQEAKRTARMLLYLLLVAGAMLAPAPVRPALRLFIVQGGLMIGLIVLLDAWTVAGKARLRRAIRRLELEQLGDVVVLDAADAGH